MIVCKKKSQFPETFFVGGPVPTLRSEFRHSALQNRRKRDYRYFSMNCNNRSRFKFFNFRSNTMASDRVSLIILHRSSQGK